MRLRFDISREDSDSFKTETDAQFVAPGNTSTVDMQPLVQNLDNPSSYINFPPPQKTVIACQRLVESFGQVIDDIFAGEAKKWNAESLLQEITKEEVNSIQKAHEFSRESSSLFQLLVSSITCDTKHTARLHLSGFRTTQLEMLLGTCDDDWIYTSFIR